jgi:hypothetical protein
MKFGFRIPSIKKRIAARTSVKRVIRHNLGFKAPRGLGWIINPKKALYNKVYNKTSRGCMFNLAVIITLVLTIVTVQSCDLRKSDSAGGTYVKPSVNYKGQVRKGYVRRKVSLKKNAIKSQNRSRYYYHTRGKYRRYPNRLDC